MVEPTAAGPPTASHRNLKYSRTTGQATEQGHCRCIRIPGRCLLLRDGVTVSG